MLRSHMLAASLLALTASAHAVAAAQDLQPEIQRKPAAAQAVGVAHTLRVIPEACVRLEGRFTGVPAAPYKFAAARTSERCQARARVVDAATGKPSASSGWVLNDQIRVPSAACSTQQAVVRIWRKDAKAIPPKLDAQGRSRIYLMEGLDAANQGKLGAIPVYATAMSVEGKACN
ncbi:MAG: hypothetical protein V4704_10625 [Pseudomonadota bacterium]